MVRSLGGDVVWGVVDGPVGYGGFDSKPGLWVASSTLWHEMPGLGEVVFHDGDNAAASQEG